MDVTKLVPIIALGEQRVEWQRTMKSGDTPSRTNLEKRCMELGLKMTGQRRVIARVLSDADDHPNVETVHHRANAIDDRISLATVYRTLRLFEEIDILDRHDFGDGRARYEQADQDHHDHLIDVKSGKVIEFQNREIEQLQSAVAQRLGYKLVGHKLELYAVRVGEDTENKDD